MIYRYCIQLNKDYVKYLLSEDQAIYINFFDWMCKTVEKTPSIICNTGNAFVNTSPCLPAVA